jgi:hypothetical protein
VYTEWRNFQTAIEKAKESCKTSNHAILDHFVDANKMIAIESGSTSCQPLRSLFGALPKIDMKKIYAEHDLEVELEDEEDRKQHFHQPHE